MNIFLVLASILLFIIISGYIRNKRAKNKIVRIIDSNCTRCQRCLKRCGHKVFDMVNDEAGMHLTVKYPQKCTACGNCLAVCKFNALELVDFKKCTM